MRLAATPGRFVVYYVKETLMLPLSAYRDAINLDQPFPRPKTDGRTDQQLFQAVLAGLPEGHLPEDGPDYASMHSTSEIQANLRLVLMGLRASQLSEDAKQATNILLYRNSAELGRTTGMNLMRVAEAMPESDYGAARHVALWRGDVRELVADAVINAALPNLQGCTDPDHPCIDNYIHAQAGPWLREDCKTINEMQGRNDVAGGAKLKPYPKDVMEASYKAAMEYYAETSAKYPDFKKIYDDYKKFLDEQNFWFRVAENEYAKFMYSRKG